MRHRIPAALTLVLAVLAALVATAGAAEDREPDRDSVRSAFDDLDFDRPDIRPGVKLHCVGAVDDGGAGSVGCRWEAGADVAVARWQLWNIQLRPERGHRNLVAELRPDQHGYVDTEVKVPAVYLYAVLGLDADGRIVARSRPDLAVVASRPHVERLRLACHVTPTDIVGDTTAETVADRPSILPRPAVGCQWSAASSRGLDGYHVYRSVDGGARELIARTGPDETSIVDDAVGYGHRYTYVVVGLGGEGETIARSRAVHVGIPPYTRPIDPPVDVRPVDVRPVEPDVRPVPDVVPTEPPVRYLGPPEKEVVDVVGAEVEGDRPSRRVTDSDLRTDAVGDGARDR